MTADSHHTRPIPGAFKTPAAILLAIAVSMGPAAADDIALRLTWDPGSAQATLDWNGGRSPYSMYRSSNPVNLEQTGNLVGQTPLLEWSDPTPPSPILYYAVSNGCDPFVPATYGSDPHVSYYCAFGLVALDVGTWTLAASSDGVLSVTGNTGLPSLSGPVVPACPTGSFSATRTDAGPCTASYDLAATYVSIARWEGTLRLGFSGTDCSDCVSQSFAVAGTRDAPACGTDADCLTGFCRDGTCCDGDCAGLCQACNLPASYGLCAPIPAGQDPALECPSGQACNGAGTCASAAGAQCAAPADCADGSCVDGVCCTTSCTGLCEACDLAGSPGTCSAIPSGQDPDAECPAGQACNGAGRCAGAPGSACSVAADCLGGECVDGVCCNSACTGLCSRCDLAGSNGTCAPIPAGQDPDAECPAGSACDGTGACATTCNPVNPPAYASAPQPGYTCAFGAVAFNVSTWNFSNLGNNTLGVSGSTGVPAMIGPGIPLCPGGSFTVARTDFAGCSTTYSLTGSFSSATQWSGTFRVSFSGSVCSDCTPRTWSVTGSR